MWTSAVFPVFLWTLLSLVTAIPTEIALSENEAEDFVPENFNNTADGSIIPQPRYYSMNRNSKTYTVYLMEVDWYTAAAHCRNYGKALASVTSLADNQRLIQTLHEYGADEWYKSFWLGATDMGSNNQFIWVSNGEPMTFNNWEFGSPNTWDGNTAHCLELSDNKWNVQDCKEKHKFICESQ